jgi:hypothetical protein
LIAHISEGIVYTVTPWLINKHLPTAESLIMECLMMAELGIMISLALNRLKLEILVVLKCRIGML